MILSVVSGDNQLGPPPILLKAKMRNDFEKDVPLDN